MKKLNSIAYYKLYLQAEEAKEQNMTKLASGILGALGPTPEDEIVTYASEQVEEDIHRGLWSLATCILKYHNVSSVNAEKINEVIESLASKFINEIESSLEVDGVRGTLEPAVLGESK